jgi:hypothetical protein
LSYLYLSLGATSGETKIDYNRSEIIGDRPFEAMAKIIVALLAATYLPCAAQEVRKYVIIGVPRTDETVWTGIFHVIFSDVMPPPTYLLTKFSVKAFNFHRYMVIQDAAFGIAYVSFNKRATLTAVFR